MLAVSFVVCVSITQRLLFQRFAKAMVGWGEVTGKGMLPKGSLHGDGLQTLRHFTRLSSFQSTRGGNYLPTSLFATLAGGTVMSRLDCAKNSLN